MTDGSRAQGREAIPEIARMLREIDICLFSTLGDGGQLHARPMSNNGEVEWDGNSWFFAPSGGRLVAELRAEPAAVTAYRADARFAFVSVSGPVTIEDDIELKKRYWQEDLKRWFPGGPEDPGVTLLRLDSHHVDWWTEEGDGSADLRQTVASS